MEGSPTDLVNGRGLGRRNVLKSAGIASGLVIGSRLPVGSVGAAADATLEGRFVSYDGEPIPHARIAISFIGDDIPYVRTDEDGYFEAQVPASSNVQLGFYKSSEDEFLAPRLDQVPHIHTLEHFHVPEGGLDLGNYSLPRAYLLNARAVFAEKPGGVEGAIPRFGSRRDRSYFASGYSSTTTNADGYMKLLNAGFTGIEMAGDVKIWMYPPTYEPYIEQERSDLAPYREVRTRGLSVPDETMVELDISHRKGEEKSRKHGTHRGSNSGDSS